MSAGWRLEHFVDFGLRAGPDMRSTLLRVLTELYLHKSTHTADEERHYTELALRLLDGVDAGTRASIAARLAHCPSPPLRVIEWLARDLPEIGTLAHASALPRQVLPAPGPAANTGKFTGPLLTADVAGELNELFLAANADERRLILLNLHVIAPFPVGKLKLNPAAGIGERLESAILARNRDGFAQQLAQALHISRVQARRLAGDDLGEPIVTAAKALNIGRAALYRILLFVNMKIGHSVARVQALAELHHEISREAAEQMVAIWQSLSKVDRPVQRYQPLFWDDGAAHSEAMKAPAHAAATSTAPAERRDAS
jgi:uncharacterized protein (DUF2336 family)